MLKKIITQISLFIKLVLLIVFLFSCVYIYALNELVKIPLADRTHGIASSNGYVFACNGENGLQIFDVKGKWISSLTTFHWARDCVVNGKYVYVADRERGLVIVDIKNIKKPRIASVTKIPMYAEGLCVDGNYAYVGCDAPGMSIINIKDKYFPEKTAQANAGQIEAVCIKGNLAYAADYAGSLSVIDIRDKANPEVLRKLYTGGNPLDVYLIKNRLYVAARQAGICVFDISDPEWPEYSETVPLNAEIWSIASNKDYIFAAGGNDGIIILKQTKNGLIEVERVPTEGYATDIFWDEGKVFLANGSSGFSIYDDKVDEKNSDILIPDYVFDEETSKLMINIDGDTYKHVNVIIKDSNGKQIKLMDCVGKGNYFIDLGDLEAGNYTAAISSVNTSVRKEFKIKI